MQVYWKNSQNLDSKSFTCGFCGQRVSSDKGFAGTYMTDYDQPRYIHIYICHHCTFPSFFTNNGHQFPGPPFGDPVQYIPEQNVVDLYNEARDCFSIRAYTSCVMCCRKLLMNISVAEGAKEGLNFAAYVEFLDKKNYIPPNGKKWVDKIRLMGNEANHKIDIRSKKESKLILCFVEMLLRFIYEMPGMLNEDNDDK